MKKHNKKVEQTFYVILGGDPEKGDEGAFVMISEKIVADLRLKLQDLRFKARFYRERIAKAETLFLSLGLSAYSDMAKGYKELSDDYRALADETEASLRKIHVSSIAPCELLSFCEEFGDGMIVPTFRAATPHVGGHVH